MDNLITSRIPRLFTLLLLCLASCHLLAQERYVLGVAAPDWVTPIAIPQGYDIPTRTIQNGTYYLLVDEQNRLDEQRQLTSFARYVTAIVNQKGMEFNSQIDIEFDPVYQQVQLHSLHIIRGGEILNKLPDTEFSLLHNEKELSSQLYNGTRTLHGIIPDLRTGDILEYSYSILGQNPVFKGAFSQWHTLQWSIPVEHLSIIYLVHSSVPLYHSFINLDAQFEKTLQGDEYIYSYARQTLPGTYLDQDRPDWYAARPHLLVSASKTWKDVADWGMALFAPSVAQDSEAIDALVEDIRATSPDKQQQIMAAIQFVQNDIRYFGIELGESSHRPSFAQDTLTRRFGDCKDKSVLLISLLRKLGVEAHPVLVDSSGLSVLNEVVPGKGWFDHAIVKVSYQDRDYWIDATREMQFGALQYIYQKDFGYGLVLKEGETGLQRITAQPVGEIVYNDTWDLTGGRDAETHFTSKIMFSGFSADKQRNRIANNAIYDIEQTYVEHFQDYYHNLSQKADMDIQDDRQNNVVTYELRFTMPDFWEEEEKRYSVDFYSHGVNYLLNEPDDIEREHPLALRYPRKVSQHIDIYLHQLEWSFTTKNETVTNSYFTYEHSVEFDAEQNLLRLKYSLEHHQDHVPVQDLDTYLQDLDTARSLKNYGIVEYKKTNSEEAASAGAANEEPTAMQELWANHGNLLMMAAAWLCLLVVYLLWRNYSQKQTPYTGEKHFYTVSKTKFVVLSLLTCGLFFYYWFYKNYQYEKATHRPRIMPFWRALFHVFFYYPLFRTLTTRFDKNAMQQSHPPEDSNAVQIPDYAVVLAVLFLGAAILSNVMEVWYTQAVLFSSLLVLPMLHMVAKANADNSWLAYNSQWHPRHLLLVPLFAPLSLYILAYDLALLPDTKVVEGKALYSHDVNFMRDNHIIKEDENIAWFYSDATLFISDDGNGVTSKSVFSYWKDDQDELIIDRATYEQIDDIRVEWSEQELDNTVIEIITLDGDEFVLYVSNEDGLDKSFVQYLNRRLKQYR